jgi:hypothetical protein
MNKYAAEKIASEYYNMGIQLALQNAGLNKTAMPSGRQLAAMLGGGGAAASMGTGTSGEALMHALRSIDPRASFDPSKLQAIMQGAKSDAVGYGDTLMDLGSRAAQVGQAGLNRSANLLENLFT